MLYILYFVIFCEFVIIIISLLISRNKKNKILEHEKDCNNTFKSNFIDKRNVYTKCDRYSYNKAYLTKNNECYYRQNPTIQYFKKKLITNCESSMYYLLKDIVPQKYILQTQIPLSSIVEKNSNSHYASELYRIIDFGIFDCQGNVLVLIELNDMSHKTYERIKRDKKVKDILLKANIPLITLWTDKTNYPNYIKSRLSSYINIA